VRALEGVFAEQDAIKREVGLLCQLVEKTTATAAREEDGDGGASDDDDARSIRTIVPHELERVEEEDEDHMAKEQQQQDEEEEEERRTRRAELGRPRTPEPMSLGMTHDEDMPRSSSSSRPSSSVMDELFQCLASLSNQLESAIELSSLLQAQHAAAQSMISVLECKVSSLESLVHNPKLPSLLPSPPYQHQHHPLPSLIPSRRC